MKFINLTGRSVLPRVKSHGYKSLEVLVDSTEDCKFIAEHDVLKVVPASYQGGTPMEAMHQGLEDETIWVASEQFGFVDYLPTKLRYFACDDVLVFAVKAGRVALPVRGEVAFLDFNTHTRRGSYTMVGMDKFPGIATRDKEAYDKVFDGTLKVNLWHGGTGDSTFKPSEEPGNVLIDNGWYERQRQLEIEKAEAERLAKIEREKNRRSKQAESFLSLVEGL